MNKAIILCIFITACEANKDFVSEAVTTFRVSPSSGCENPTSGSMTGTITMPEGFDVPVRNFRVDAPPWWDGTTPIPVAYTFHACGGDHLNGSYNGLYYRSSQSQWLAAGIDPYDLLVVMGDAEETCWELDPSEEDLSYVELLRERVESTYCVDTERRYHAGISSGGFAAQSFACQLGGVAAVFAGASGMHYPQGIGYGLTPTPLPQTCAEPTPVMLMHGTTDALVPIATYGVPARDLWLEVNGCTNPQPYVHLVPAANAQAAPDPGSACTGLNGCSCVRYECTNAPVVWCEHSGGHVWPPYHRDATVNWFGPFIDEPQGGSSSGGSSSSSEGSSSTTCEMVCQCI